MSLTIMENAKNKIVCKGGTLNRLQLARSIIMNEFHPAFEVMGNEVFVVSFDSDWLDMPDNAA